MVINGIGVGGDDLAPYRGPDRDDHPIIPGEQSA